MRNTGYTGAKGPDKYDKPHGKSGVMRPKSAQWFPPLDECGYTVISSGEYRSIDVHESEKDTWTGLYDANGNKIHRQLNPIGFKIKR